MGNYMSEIGKVANGIAQGQTFDGSIREVAKEGLRSTPEYQMLNFIAGCASGLGVAFVILAIILLVVQYYCVGTTFLVVGILMSSFYPLLHYIL